MSRAKAMPAFWCGAALPAGINSVDAFLLHVGRSMTEALQTTYASAEVSRAQLRETRAALHAAIDARCDELATNIDSAEAGKAASLERELVNIDAALEKWRAESRAVHEAASSLSDADLLSQQPDFYSRLDDLEAQLQALPTTVVEPPHVGLLADAPALLSSIACFGCVISPLAITASDLSLVDAPSNVRPGDTLRLRLSLGARHAAKSAEELEVSLGRLAVLVHVVATLEGPGVDQQPLQATIAPDASQRCLTLSVGVPLSAIRGTSLCLRAVSVAGLPFAEVPLSFVLRHGIVTPLKLSVVSSLYYTTPVISREGRAYCPQGTGSVGDVLVFDADGSPLPSLSVGSLGLLTNIRRAAYADGETPSLLLACLTGALPRLVAVDPTTCAVRWTLDERRMDGQCNGIVALPSLGVVVVSDPVFLSAQRLSDGRHVGSVRAPQLNWFLAADDASGVVFGSTEEYRPIVHAWTCATVGAEIRFTPAGPVVSAGARPNHRPLAVMPPAPGKKVSHLVVGNAWTSELLVISLPGLSLVHTHRLEGMEVTGLAADPWGGALAVCDRLSQSLHVLAWPLPGMPPLL